MDEYYICFTYYVTLKANQRDRTNNFKEFKEKKMKRCKENESEEQGE